MDHHITIPEDAQANGFAEACVKIMGKLVHTALVERRDPRKMVSSYLMAYRATPHKFTGRSPAKLLFNRKILFLRTWELAKIVPGKIASSLVV